jgi:hypothetical protein
MAESPSLTDPETANLGWTAKWYAADLRVIWGTVEMRPKPTNAVNSRITEAPIAASFS